MGNKILGKRSRSFYRGFNDRQLEYLRQKFQTLAEKGIISKKLFMDAYKLNDAVCDNFFEQMDFTQDKKIEEYQFVCIAHSLCSMTVQQLGGMLYDICTKGKIKIDQKGLLNFTSVCLSYNSYLEKKKIKDTQITKENKNKFQKYDFDKNKIIDRDEFIKICMKDIDYKKWMLNMGFITERQMDFQQQIYDLVDSDMEDQIARHETKTNENVDKIKRGIEHRIDDDQFQVVETVGEQSAASQKPWKKSIRGIQIKKENQNAPSQNLTIDHIYGYRSYDCRNNLKLDSRGRVVYHQGAVGIVAEIGPKGKVEQSYLIQHQDDISCLDICDDMVATGQVGTKPVVIVWETTKKDGLLKEDMIISKQLEHSVGNVCLSKSKNLLAATCNDQEHKIVIYDLKRLRQIQNDLTSQDTGILAFGPSGKNCILDLKFTPDQKILVAATLKEIMWMTFQKGALNMNRGQFKNFSNSPTLCLISLKANYKNEPHEFIISGMGNGSIYFWENGQCIKAVCGHSGSVSAICQRKDCKSFISGDKTGKIIIWNEKFEKEKSIQVGKTNCLSKMIVSLSCSKSSNDFLFGTKSSDIFTLKIGDDFSKANRIMAGHSDGTLWAVAIHQTQPYFYTGGQDQRLLKWEYKQKKHVQKQVKCKYKIRSIDLNDNRKLLAVGYFNGTIQCFGADQLDKKPHSFNKIKNPDQETLNLVKFDGSGTMLAVCYQLPSFKILLLAVQQRAIKLISEISLNHKIISLDFQKNAKYIQLNTADIEYSVYDISNPKQAKKVKPSLQDVRKCTWLTHTVALSPETKGIITQGVSEEDIVCCDRSRKFKNVIVIGDKFSKIKLFNYPTDKNQIFNKYFGHSNQVTGVKFNFSEDYLISIGGQEKSIIVWKYDPDLVNNQFFISNLLEGDSDYQEYKKEKQGHKEHDQFAVQEETGQQAMATKPFLGQIFPPQDFEAMYNAKRDNKLPQQSIKIKHAFGIRTTYLKDQVRNQCKFSKSFEDFVFPTACLAVKMNIQSRQQDIFLQHKEDIVSFAIDSKKQIMATGQMAEKNDVNKLKKVLSIYVWDIENKKVLSKLDGFHTIAVVLLSFSPNSKYLFTCGNDDKNTFAVYDWKSSSIIYSGPVSRAKVNGIAWKNDHQFLTCGNDHVKFWTNNKGRQGKIKGQTAGMFSCVSAKSIYITGDGSGGLYNWVGDQSSAKINGHSGKVQTMIVNGDYMYSGADDGKILAWRLQKNGQIKHAETFYDTRNVFQQMRKTIPINEEQYGILSLDIAKNGSFLIATKGASVIFANPSKNQAKVVHQGHYKGELWALAVRNGQQFFFTGGDDHTVRLWDIKGRREINRVYFENKVRGIDCSSQKDPKVIVADGRAKLHLYNKNLTDKLCQQYKGKPFAQNSKEKNDPFVEDIKFSPDGQYIAYGCHLKSRWMQFVKVEGRKLKLHKQFKAGTSALLNVDWSRDSSMISINTQAYQYMFFNINGDKVSASSLRDENWATWTRKFGWPVQGVFQGVDYTDVNTVCRDPTGNYLAVGYDDQTIRLFRYPCYIPKQISKQYYGHSSHVTRIKFSPNHLISVGGLDRTIIVWDIQGAKKKQRALGKLEQQQSDGLEDLDEDVDVPGKAIARKVKVPKVQEFFEAHDQGDQFMAIKPWLGAIKQPDEQYPKQNTKAPNSKLQLQYVQGYRCKDCRQNLYYSSKDVLIFHAAAVLIYHNIASNTQQIVAEHADDILSIDYHRQSNQVITGQLGPKPLVCLVKDGKVKQKFRAPVTKGVLALAISPNGDRAVCVGMDEDHHVAILKLDQQKPLAKSKGGKKVILKVGWVSDSEFVTVGIAHFKYWTFDGKLSAKQGKNRQNLVCLAIKDGLILTGASKGKIISWKGNSKSNEVSLRLPLKAKGDSKEQSHASVVQSISIQASFIAAGTKDGYLYILDKQSLKQINVINMEEVFSDSNFKAESSALRAIDFLESQSSFCVGTLGAQVYTVKYRDLVNDGKLVAKNILKCHYSPNNSWTNQVWGLCVQNDCIFTCSDDSTLRCWSLSDKKLLSCVSLNYDQNKRPLEKDKATRDFQECAKGRAVSLSPDKQEVIVGCKDGTVRVYSFKESSYQMQFKYLFKHAKQWISDIKTAFNTVIIGSHDNAIYVYDYEDAKMKRRYKPMKKHSSYITHLDVSRDSCFLQSTCGAYQILFWDLNNGKQITSGGTMLKNERWATWTCNLGWPVQGIYPKCTDGTFINAVDRSHFSINQTLYQDDKKSPFLLASGNDQGKVCLYNYPCTIKSSEYIEGNGHSSHVTNVKWSSDDKYLISTGGQDQCVMYWKVVKKSK